MPIPESQLETWSGQGAITTAKQTHESIRNALTTQNSPIEDKNFEIYLQGSYKNDTNIRGDSDVDVVVQLNQTFQYDLSALSDDQKETFHKTYGNATYLWADFRKDVLQALQDYFGKPAVTEGNKSIKIKASSGRLPADVIPCLEYRKYFSFQTLQSQKYVPGIVFYTLREQRRIINFPIPHYHNGVQKNSGNSTKGLYKPNVRVFKNCRTYMESHGTLQDLIAPSYFVECLMYNVPDENYAGDYQTACYNILKWLSEADLTNFNCQNGQTSLFGSTSEQWTIEKAQTYIQGFIKLWNNWK
jgi:hypothetical protein